MSHRLIHGDCLYVLRGMDAESVDAIVTDPPYELGFMGRRWDASGIAFRVDLWTEALRVLKPGGHLLAFGGPRTYHRMACAIEDAGFEIRDSIHWIFGSGFPKSRSMQEIGRPELGTALKPAHEPVVVARKPLSEPTVAANVLKHGTGAINVDACRVGGSYQWHGGPRTGAFAGGGMQTGQHDFAPHNAGRWPPNLLLSHLGPDADGNGGCQRVGVKRVKAGPAPYTRNHTVTNELYGKGLATQEAGAVMQGYADATGHEEVDAWACAPGCPIRLLDEQSGVSKSTKGKPRQSAVPGNGYGMTHTGAEYTDQGTASRFFPTFAPDVPPFFYQAKASRGERNRGLEGMPEHDPPQKYNLAAVEGNPRKPAPCTAAQPVANSHPTVKPVALMRWLVRLVTPPGGTVLDMFCGSGSTGVAALIEGFDFIGIEREAEYIAIAEQRIATEVLPLFALLDAAEVPA